MLRHYLYISKHKVDMYFSQLPMQRKKTIAAELGFNLGVLSGKLQTERESLVDPIHRLQLVEKAIRADHLVRPVGSTANWIDDQLGMAYLAMAENRGLMFYMAEIDDHVFALGGSASNLIGTAAPAETTSSISHASRLLEALEQVVVNRPIDRPRRELRRSLHRAVTMSGRVTPWTKLLDETSQSLAEQPKINVRFLARVLQSERWSLADRRYTLATPLYIELA